MLNSRRVLAIAAAAALLSMRAGMAGAAEEASPWVQGFHSRVRLVAAGAEPGGHTRLAGIAIELDGGFKTYWRHPGESGLPPAFDWTGSENVAGTEVLWPAPSRFEDAAGISHGYKDRVVLPVRVTPADSAKPVRLSLRLEYGVCKDICIPASAALKLELGPQGSGDRAAIADALRRVPQPMPLGASGALSVVAVEPQAADGKAMIAATVRAPAGATLFVEAPESWYLAPGQLQPAQGRPEGRFPIEILERPRDAAGPLDLRLTLVAGDRAVETRATLDTGSLPR